MKNKRKIISILLTIFIIVFFQVLCTYANHKNYFCNENGEICLTPGENETMLNFSWYSGKKEDNKVKILNENGEEKIYVGEHKQLEDNLFSNKVKVTDLNDNTTYYYSYKINGEWSKLIEYKTKNSKEFTFAFMGDPQIGASSQKNEGVEIDKENWNKAISKVLEKNKNLSFIICAGDETNEHEDKKSIEKIDRSDFEYSGFLSPSYLEYIPLANVIGNHDKDNENFYNHFYMPNLSNLGSTIAGGDYFFTYGDVIFLCLNTNNLDIKEHKEFLQDSLSKNLNKKWKIVCFHHDIYGDGVHKNEKNIKQLREELPHILEENNIDLVLCGHDHIYSRTYPLKNSKKSKEVIIKTYDDNNEKDEIYNNPRGIIYITGGSSTGSKFYKSNNEKGKYTKFKYDKKNPVYTIINVNHDKIIISTYKVKNNKIIDNRIIINKYKTNKH